MADETTIYRVVTQYIIQDEGSTANVTRGVSDLERMIGRGRSSLQSFNRGFGDLVRYIGPLVGIGTATAAIVMVLRNINSEFKYTNQLAAQFNTAFTFSADPLRNFTAGIAQARKLAGELIYDAARLPGTAAQFFSTANQIAATVFSGGRGPQAVRRLTGEIALGAEFAGQTQEDAGRQAYRILSGQASIGDNPLFARLRPLGLPANVNQLSAAKRFDELDKALGRIVNNPIFREQVTNTLETQLSTLQDVLFGSRGIGGQVFHGAFVNLVSGLKSVNDLLTANVDPIVGGFRMIGDGIATLGKIFLAVPLGLFQMIAGADAASAAKRFMGEYKRSGDAGEITSRILESAGIAPRNEFMARGGRNAADRVQTGFGYAVNQNLSKFIEGLMPGEGSLGGYSKDSIQNAVDKALYDTGGIGKPGTPKTAEAAEQLSASMIQKIRTGLIGGLEGNEKLTLAAPPQITQNFGPIRIDMKTDASPEAIALNLHKALRIVGRAPLTSERGLSAIPGTSATR